MDNTEKLIALTMCHCSLIAADACPKSSDGKCTVLDCATCLANHLIDNGVVPVVRCKDCKKRSPSVNSPKNAIWCREFRAYMPCNGFCSYGESGDEK